LTSIAPDLRERGHQRDGHLFHISAIDTKAFWD
jgi:hypothetical protein